MLSSRTTSRLKLFIDNNYLGGGIFMFNNEQVTKFVESLELSYKWTNPVEGANSIIVEDAIEYKPFACKLRDLRIEKNYTSNTTEIFKKLCKELAQRK